MVWKTVSTRGLIRVSPSLKTPHQFKCRAILTFHQCPRAQHQDRILVRAGLPRMRAGDPNPLTLDRREQLPPVNRIGRGLQPTRPLPDFDRILTRDQTAAAIVVRPTPDPVQAPAQIFERIAKMSHLPVEDSVDAPLFVEEKISGPVVAVDDAHFLRGSWRIAAHPSNRGTNYRLRNQFVGIEHAFPVVEFALPTILGCD